MAYNVPRVGIGLFLLNSKNQFLMGKRLSSVGAGTYGLPGGHLDLHESFEAAAARELCEETSIVIPETSVSYVTAVNLPNFHDKHFVSIFLKARLATEVDVVPRVTEPQKCAGWDWFTWDEVLSELQKARVLRQQTGNAKVELQIDEGRNIFEAFHILVSERPDAVRVLFDA